MLSTFSDPFVGVSQVLNIYLQFFKEVLILTIPMLPLVSYTCNLYVLVKLCIGANS